MLRRSWTPPLALAATMFALACSDTPLAPPPAAPTTPALAVTAADLATPHLVRALAAGRGIGRLSNPPHVRPELVRLGRALAFDPILSGNRNISCTTCHLTTFATGDGKALSVGEGGSGLGPDRTHPGGVFIPRNAPPLFNLGAMTHLFWDGRVQVDQAGHLQTPAGSQITPAMRRVYEFGPVSALAMFPVTNRAEMRGTGTSNELAAIPDEQLTTIWTTLMHRLGAIPEYRRMFHEAYPGTPFRDMTFAHASNAIGGFFVSELSFNNTPWDHFLAGNDHALSQRQLEGAKTFLTLKCSICHAGATFSDEKFHNVAVAQFGPGQGDGPSGRDDFGRMRVTGDPADRYLFRTTPLRNVELTGPYGHDGAIASLRGFVEHYSESDLKLLSFDENTLEPALRGTLLQNASDILAQRDTLLNGVVLTDELVGKLMDYMLVLTDNAARDLSRIAPRRVPSGLPMDRP